jgi:phenylalanyl-tRNA synthetase beta chain
MKISYNWLKSLINITKTPEEISLILTDIGLEVESLTKVQSIPGGLEGLVVGHVLSCEQHPNADRLRLTSVDIGLDAPLSIVCGAPNVAKGQKVIVAPVNTWVYPLEGDPFEIKKSKIRGEVSEGMICAEDEIGLGKSHEGIMILPEGTEIGKLAKDHFDLQDDFVYLIGLTPNRADAASHLGVARDLAAYLRTDYNLPDVYDASSGSASEVKVTVEEPELCPRYTSLTIKGVEVKDSPEWLKEKLIAIGLRPINNIVDITNFVLHELGQPLHAFDADKIAGKHILVKKAEADRSFTTLDGVERKLNKEDLVISDESEPLVIAGVFGGVSSGVTEDTKNVFLESAYFNSVSVRKTAKRHGLNTDTSFRFERGTDPNMTVFAIQRAAYLIQKIAGSKDISEISDFYPNPVSPFSVPVYYKNVQRVIGKEIPKAEIKEIIEALEIWVVADDGELLQTEVPAYKVDVTREIDIIEEVLRIYGYNNIEIQQQMKASLNTSPKPDKEVVQNLVSDFLIANGYHEILNNSLTKLAYAEDQEKAVKILNPLSGDLSVMRQTLLFSGLETIEYNQKRRNSSLRLFEFGKTYFLEGEKYVETEHLSLFITGKDASEQWNHQSRPVSFFQIKGAIDGLLKRLNIQSFQVQDVAGEAFAYGLNYHRGTQSIVSFGAIKSSLLNSMDIENEVFYADINWEVLLKAIRNNSITYREVSKFPSVRRDLALLIDNSVTFSDLERIAQKTDKRILRRVNVFDVYQGDRLPAGKKSYALSFTFQDEEKTLTDKQIDALVQKLIINFGKEANAEVRK